MTKTVIEKAQKSYFGMSGQHYVMSEYLVRGYNVAIPEVDVGDDVIVIKDDIGTLVRVQFKSVNLKRSINKKRGTRYSTQVNIRRDQLETDLSTKLFYFIPFRFNDKWQTVLIISREDLQKLWNDFMKKTSKRKGREGSSVSKQITINFTMNNEFKAIQAWNKTEFDPYREKWTDWPSKFGGPATA